ncbi:MAG: ThiF family adenylyltransferase [Candidatus Lokiarchaeota archaeon]|nr:ThiF family adenylyltransferase [Candidatus Lokiarchaeota archaeon]
MRKMNNHTLSFKDYFQRQMQIPNFNQDKLRLNILISGLGGTGTHIALACVRLGVKTIKIIDNDIIEPSNLNRQVLYKKHQVGKRKSQIAEKQLEDFNLTSNIESYDFDIFRNWQSFLEQLKNSDFIFCCLDLPIIKRLAVASACLFFKKPMIYAGIDVVNANSGMILYQAPEGNPCYECMELCLTQLNPKFLSLFQPNYIIKQDEIKIDEIQEIPNFFSSSNYYIASIISNLAVNLMIQNIQSWIKPPNRIIFDAYNWELSKFFLNRNKYCKIC